MKKKKKKIQDISIKNPSRLVRNGECMMKMSEHLQCALKKCCQLRILYPQKSTCIERPEVDIKKKSQT